MGIPDSGSLEELMDGLWSQCSSPINPHLAQITDKIKNNNNLSDDEAGEAMKLLMSEDIAQAQQAEFLVSMQGKGPTASELASFAFTLRELAHPLPLELHESQFPLADTCGTGGGTLPTFNVSTTIIFILAAAGISIAKHGNRAVTSNCGSADVLEALGVKIDLSPSSVKECIQELGIGFLFAPLFHKAFKNIMPVRKKLAPYTQTVFNLLGPLVNPAFGSSSDRTPCVHVLGVNDPGLVEVFAQVLKILKIQRAMVVHGYSDNMGMDELSTAGKTLISELKSDGTIDNYSITPEESGLIRASNSDLAGGTDNARIITDILTGKETGPRLDLALLNAAAGLYVAGCAENIRAGIKLARSKIDDGSAKRKLDDFIRLTNQKT